MTASHQPDGGILDLSGTYAVLNAFDGGGWEPSTLAGPLGSSLGSIASYLPGSVVSALGSRWRRKVAGNEPVFTRSSWSRAGMNNTRGVYMPDTFGQFWYPALASAKAGAGLAQLAVVGDSVSVGYYASNLDTTSWVGLLRTALQSYAGDGGSGWKGIYECSLGLGTDGVNATNTAAWGTAGCLVALTGTWTENMGTYDGPGFSPMRASTAGATAAYTVRGRLVTVRVWQRNTGATSFTVQIDGGATATITFSTGTSSDGNYTFAGSLATGIGTYQIDLGAAATGNHAVVVTNGSASTFDLMGVSGRNAAGIVVDKYAHGGFCSVALNNASGGTTTAFINTVGTWGNNAAAGTAAPSGKYSGGSLNPADCVIYAMGLNDAGSVQTSPDNYALNVRAYIADVLDGGTQTGTTDVVFFVPHPGTIENGRTTVGLHAEYSARLRGIAEYYGAAIIDMGVRGRHSWNFWNSQGYWGNNGAAGGVSGTDQVHLSDAGHQQYFAAIASMLLVA